MYINYLGRGIVPFFISSSKNFLNISLQRLINIGVVIFAILILIFAYSKEFSPSLLLPKEMI